MCFKCVLNVISGRAFKCHSFVIQTKLDLDLDLPLYNQLQNVPFE